MHERKKHGATNMSRYQNIFRIIVWLIFLAIYSQAGLNVFCFSRFLESTNYTHSQRTFATAGKTAECTRRVGDCPLLHDAFFHN